MAYTGLYIGRTNSFRKTSTICGQPPGDQLNAQKRRVSSVDPHWHNRQATTDTSNTITENGESRPLFNNRNTETGNRNVKRVTSVKDSARGPRPLGELNRTLSVDEVTIRHQGNHDSNHGNHVTPTTPPSSPLLSGENKGDEEKELGRGGGRIRRPNIVLSGVGEENDDEDEAPQG